ncbi:MAG: HDIG domain-containing protein, partial [Clostridia bacterium]
KRGALIAAGTVGSIFGGVVIVSGSMILAYTWNSALIYAGLHVAAGLILSVFCVGMLSVWENVFDIVTNARLHELANTNHPLLKKMMTAAPGTYHHSMMAASLAEGAAEAIGANSLLARTGAMYHDVGKLRRPQYFKENQSNGRNIHDTLPPEESAGYIIAHVKDADALLNKYRMPSAIRKIANEHHGTTLVSYFYYKAKQQQTVDGEPVIERLFRYNGNLPNTKESAIVMLADSCEAAVRSLGDPTKDEVANMVRKVVQSKLDDGQLNECPLTFAEITKIEKSFLVTFSGLMHERIRYPGIESK